MNIFKNFSTNRKFALGAIITGLLLLSAPSAYALGPNLVKNPSAEEVNPATPSRPANWTTNIHGTNTSKFEHLNTGLTGNRSVKVTMSQRTNGDAKWVFAPVNVSSGTSYTWSNNYKSSVTTWVVMKKIRANGSEAWVTLGGLPASSTWKKGSFSFTPEAGITQVIVHHLLDKVGYLTTDDTSLATTNSTTPPITRPDLSKGLVSLTFDDAWRSIYQNALPILTKYNVKSTQYVNTNPVKVATEPTTAPYPYMMPYMVKEFHNKGHEIASHSVNHPRLSDVSSAELNYQLTESKRYLTALTGVVPKNFAAPYGAFNTFTLNETAKHYRSNRSYNGTGYNQLSSFDIRNITTKNVYNTTTLAEIKGWIDYAKANKVWAVLVFHDIDPNPRTYGYTPTGLEEIIKYLQATSTPVVTVDQGINVMQGL